MKLLYCADLHGNGLFWRRLFSLAAEERAGAVIIGGDLLPKTGEVTSLIGEQRRFITDGLHPLLASFRGRNRGTEVFAMMGNDDFAVNMDLLEDMEKEGLMGLLHMKVHPLAEGLSIAGYGCVRPTPFSCKDWERFDDEQRILQPGPYGSCISTPEGLVDVDQEEWFASLTMICDDLEELSGMSDPSRTVYVIHDPPCGTDLDVLYSTEHIGSMAVRRFIEGHQPPLVLSGHIHESPKVSGQITDMIGSTLCVNPGQTESVLQAVTIDIPGYRVRLV